MRDVSLWRALVGVEKTVIERVEFDEDAEVLVVHVRPERRQRGRCGICGRHSTGYDAGPGRRRWRALDLGTIRAQLEADASRVACRSHGVVVASVPWALTTPVTRTRSMIRSRGRRPRRRSRWSPS